MEAIRRLDTCTVANAIEKFEIRPRNEGFCDSNVRCLFPRLNPMLGYAATAKISCSSPATGGHNYPERADWWNYILKLPAQRVVVVEDVDCNPGCGAFFGEVQANILLALGCVGAVTNGSVRDLPVVEAAGFHFFAGSVAVSHAYVHIVEIGGPVAVGGLKIQSGDILYGDAHGVLSIPKEIAAEVPAAAAKIIEQEQKVIALCRSREFSTEKLREAVKAL